MLHLFPVLCLVPRFSLEKGNCCQGINGSRRCAGVRGAVTWQAGSGGGVARSRSGGRRTCQGLELIPLHAAGQVGLEEQLLPLLIVHRCCWHSLPLLNLPGGVQHTQTQQQPV